MSLSSGSQLERGQMTSAPLARSFKQILAIARCHQVSADETCGIYKIDVAGFYVYRKLKLKNNLHPKNALHNNK